MLGQFNNFFENRITLIFMYLSKERPKGTFFSTQSKKLCRVDTSLALVAPRSLALGICSCLACWKLVPKATSGNSAIQGHSAMQGYLAMQGIQLSMGFQM
jgi:hypothetical protein